MSERGHITQLFTKRSLLFNCVVLSGVGVLCGLGQAPLDWFLITLVGFCLVLHIFEHAKSAKAAFAQLWSLGFGYFAFTLRWLVAPFMVYAERDAWMAPFALILMAAGIALFWGLAGLCAYKLRAYRVFSLVLTLTTAEGLRSLLFTGFPWGLIGHALIDTPYAQLSAVTGPHGLTFLALLTSWALYKLSSWSKAESVERWNALVVIALGGILWPTLQHLTPPLAQSHDSLPLIRLVQPNAPQHQKWDPVYSDVFFQRQLSFSQLPTPQTPDLIVWPEAAIPTLLNYADPYFEQIYQAVPSTPVLLGVNRSEAGRYYNSAAILHNNSLTSLYDKQHLVPFGEYTPVVGWLSQLELFSLDSLKGSGFSAGTTPQSLDIPGVGTVRPLICYEGIFSEEVSPDGVRPRAMTLLTNDAWFGHGAGPHQHLAQARLRAIEQGLPVVRVANTGISAMIDPYGRITHSLPLDQAGFIDAPLPEVAATTVYSRFGDTVPFFTLFMLLTFVLHRTRKQTLTQ